VRAWAARLQAVLLVLCPQGGHQGAVEGAADVLQHLLGEGGCLGNGCPQRRGLRLADCGRVLLQQPEHEGGAQRRAAGDALQDAGVCCCQLGCCCRA